MSDSFETSSSSSSESSSSSPQKKQPQSSTNNTNVVTSAITMTDEQRKQQQIQKELASVLASGSWKAVKDPKGRTYYYNSLTYQTTWDLVKELNLGASAGAGVDGSDQKKKTSS